MDDLERRIELLEERIKQNQHTVQELMKMNSELINKISELSSKMSTMLNAASSMRRSDLHSKGAKVVSGAEDFTTDPLERRVEKLEKKIDSVIIACSPMLKRKPVRTSFRGV